MQDRCEESLNQAMALVHDRVLKEVTLLKQSGERVSEDIEAHVKENLQAWSKAQLESVHQQAGNLSADLVSRMCTESEVIAQDLHDRLQSDARLLETRVAETIQSRLQRVNEEFHSVIQRAFM